MKKLSPYQTASPAVFSPLFFLATQEKTLFISLSTGVREKRATTIGSNSNSFDLLPLLMLALLLHQKKIPKKLLALP